MSVDVMVSSTPGLIAQMSGFLTRNRYKYVCVFLDHHSDLSFTYMLQTQSTEEILKAKAAFEAYCESMQVRVKHYHSDNGIFAAGGWRQDCKDKRQGLSYAGVGSHHQNGRVECRI